MEVAVSVAEKAIDLLFGVAIKNIRYMWKCSENVKTFKDEVENLTNLKKELEERIPGAKHVGKDTKDLEKWIKDANDIISEATTFITDEDESKKTCCNIPFCVNLCTLYHYGRMATKKTFSLQQLKDEGKPLKKCTLNPLSDPTFVDLYQKKDLENIETQKSCLKEIIKAINDQQIVGIDGLGGVGKTTLAKEVAVEMKNDFNHIEFITISQTINKEKIKEGVDVAAKRINNGDKVLIILDDVWEELKLDEVGIPCGKEYANCKILITSRKKDVCEAMKAKPIISVNPLPKEEAERLFERVAGMSEWNAKDERKPYALKIVHECGGLPLFIKAIGTALRNKKLGIWKATLGRLKDPTGEDLEYKTQGIMQLKLSYDFLKSEVAKSCFLLCSMFPEDATIGCNTLACYGLALGIFNKDEDCSVQNAKDIVQVAVDSLKSSFLLLPNGVSDEGEEFFKMHDLVRDMAILIASKGDHMFWVQSGKGLTEWQPQKYLERYKKISLMGNPISTLLLSDHELLFPHLDTFLIQGHYKLHVVPHEFFRGMEKLKVLDMSYSMIYAPPQSVKHLTKLVMLDLSRNLNLCNISLLGELLCLEILKLRRTRIEYIPKEIGKLKKLRLLDVYNCLFLSYVTPGVISKLIKLEELYLGLKKEGKCEFLMELVELKSLIILHLSVPNLHYIPNDFPIETLTEFRIVDKGFHDHINCRKRFLQISEFNFSYSPIMKLMQLSEVLKLVGIENLVNIVTSLYREGFDELKYVELEGCNNVTRLVNTCDLDAMQFSNKLGPEGKFFSKVEEIRLVDLSSLEVLWDRSHRYISFCNLDTIYIINCPSLSELFPLSVAKGLVNLRTLRIFSCESLVVVISVGDEQTSGKKVVESTGSEIVETSGSKSAETGKSQAGLVKHDMDVIFPRLANISLCQLPKLESFYSGNYAIKYPCLWTMQVKDCGSMKTWSCGDNHTPMLNIDHQVINDQIAAMHKLQGSLLITRSGMQQR